LSEADIDRVLEEDIRFGDLTVRALAIGEKPGRMVFTARRDLVLCGSDEASRLLSRLGASVIFAAQTGTFVEKGALLLEAEGTAAALHAGWKTAQTLMEWASGVATLTREIVAAARLVAPRIAVVCTRKAVPFTRQLSFKAIIAGGAECHRLGLFDTIMLFDEHRPFLTKPNDLNAIITKLKEYAPERAIMVEVTSEADAFGAAEAMAYVVQHEKFTPNILARVVLRREREWMVARLLPRRAP
jgi:molybdenum transport protein